MHVVSSIWCTLLWFHTQREYFTERVCTTPYYSTFMSLIHTLLPLHNLLHPPSFICPFTPIFTPCIFMHSIACKQRYDKIEYSWLDSHVYIKVSSVSVQAHPCVRIVFILTHWIQTAIHIEMHWWIVGVHPCIPSIKQWYPFPMSHALSIFALMHQSIHIQLRFIHPCIHQSVHSSILLSRTHASNTYPFAHHVCQFARIP